MGHFLCKKWIGLRIRTRKTWNNTTHRLVTLVTVSLNCNRDRIGVCRVCRSFKSVYAGLFEGTLNPVPGTVLADTGFVRWLVDEPSCRGLRFFMFQRLGMGLWKIDFVSAVPMIRCRFRLCKPFERRHAKWRANRSRENRAGVANLWEKPPNWQWSTCNYIRRFCRGEGGSTIGRCVRGWILSLRSVELLGAERWIGGAGRGTRRSGGGGGGERV